MDRTEITASDYNESAGIIHSVASLLGVACTFAEGLPIEFSRTGRAALQAPAQVSTQRFYQKSRLATELQGLVQHSIFQHDDQLLAQQQHQSGTVETTLLATPSLTVESVRTRRGR